MKKAWDTHPLCAHCKKTRTKNKFCAKCHRAVVQKPRKKKKKKEPRLTKAMKQSFVAQAKQQYHDEGTCEVDDNAEVSYVSPAKGGDGGAYVQGWLWVSGEKELEIPYG